MAFASLTLVLHVESQFGGLRCTVHGIVDTCRIAAKYRHLIVGRILHPVSGRPPAGLRHDDRIFPTVFESSLFSLKYTSAASAVIRSVPCRISTLDRYCSR